jgi:hypothetical protein
MALWQKLFRIKSGVSINYTVCVNMEVRHCLKRYSELNGFVDIFYLLIYVCLVASTNNVFDFAVSRYFYVLTE